MPYILAGFIVFWIVLSALRGFARANPAALVQALRMSGGGAALLLAAFLLLRGRIDLALPLGGFGLWLLANRSAGAWFGRAARPSSRVRSAMIEMELDLASGAVRGVVLAGADEGKSLDAMSRPQCEALYRLCLRDDPDGARLLEAYFDRRFPGWRAAGDAGDDARGQRANHAPRRPGVMSEDEAYEVLGLHKGASRDDVVRSHRSLMKKLHPDHGGSTDLAARVNEAKDVLMRRHH